MVSNQLTDGIASWYVWFSDNRTDESGDVYGTYRQNLNTQLFQVEPKYGDFYDKVGYRHSTGHRYSGGMANDMYAVYAQGLSGAMTLINEPFKGHCEFRFLGDPGTDYQNNNPNGGDKNTKYYSSKKIDAYINPRLPSTTGKIQSIVITKEDGVRYVFGQPVYTQYMKGPFRNYLTHDKVVDSEDDVGDVHLENYYYSSHSNTRTDGYAIAWLLSAVLYPDYIPSNDAVNKEKATDETDNSKANGVREDLIPDDNAKGNWVKFEYGLYDDFYLCNTNYENSTLESAANISRKQDFDGTGVGPDGKTKAWNRVAKQQIYLRAARTNTHTCIFKYSKKGVRTDAYESVSALFSRIGDNDNTPRNPPRLDEIILMRNEDVATPGDPFNWSKQYTYDTDKAVTGWEFTYAQRPEHQLCRGIPNSDNNADGKLDATDIDAKPRGKLTLTQARMYGKGKKAQLPPYQFKYYNDETWGKYKFDRWGYYKSNGTRDYHVLDNGERWTDTDAKQFNLRQIGLPSGSTLNIDYQSDRYLRVGKLALDDYEPRESEMHNAHSEFRTYEITLTGTWYDCGKGDKFFKYRDYVEIDIDQYVEAATDRVIVQVQYLGRSDKEDKTDWYVRFERGDGWELGRASEEADDWRKFRFVVDKKKTKKIKAFPAAKFRSCRKTNKSYSTVSSFRIFVIIEPNQTKMKCIASLGTGFVWNGLCL